MCILWVLPVPSCAHLAYKATPPSLSFQSSLPTLILFQLMPRDDQGTQFITTRTIFFLFPLQWSINDPTKSCSFGPCNVRNAFLVLCQDLSVGAHCEHTFLSRQYKGYSQTAWLLGVGWGIYTGDLQDIQPQWLEKSIYFQWLNYSFLTSIYLGYSALTLTAQLLFSLLRFVCVVNHWPSRSLNLGCHCS